ncbi:uncharacterized protein CTRU02_206952 [Colletotrichum truncatum]|uniref:Uncharacterized protein n=1 Tax=Colletotrichum truncatum TaxID=5467 RepID=A0ACC3YZ45_COLTU|nr:uncharacterized protein CTRU02_11194 [Colletotrichum truncatum]KAF6786323.1 hypothetical protein CTRU02_11194 [Colletotrichum truncatum]
MMTGSNTTIGMNHIGASQRKGTRPPHLDIMIRDAHIAQLQIEVFLRRNAAIAAASKIKNLEDLKDIDQNEIIQLQVRLDETRTYYHRRNQSLEEENHRLRTQNGREEEDKANGLVCSCATTAEGKGRASSFLNKTIDSKACTWRSPDPINVDDMIETWVLSGSDSGSEGYDSDSSWTHITL